MNRNEEYKDNSDAPKYPSLFVRMPDTLVGHGQPILRPSESEQLDYEGEIAIVIGKTGRRIPEDQAESHIAGITCMNEGSIRDWLRHGKFNVTQGKNFVGSGALGPTVGHWGRNRKLRQSDRNDAREWRTAPARHHRQLGVPVSPPRGLPVHLRTAQTRGCDRNRNARGRRCTIRSTQVAGSRRHGRSDSLRRWHTLKRGCR